MQVGRQFDWECSIRYQEEEPDHCISRRYETSDKISNWHLSPCRWKVMVQCIVTSPIYGSAKPCCLLCMFAETSRHPPIDPQMATWWNHVHWSITIANCRCTVMITTVNIRRPLCSNDQLLPANLSLSKLSDPVITMVTTIAACSRAVPSQPTMAGRLKYRFS